MMLTRCPDADEGARAELRRLYFAYVNLMEVGRDRIVGAGGSCDPVDVMEAGDPALIRVRKFFTEDVEAASTLTPAPAPAKAPSGPGYVPVYLAKPAPSARETITRLAQEFGCDDNPSTVFREALRRATGAEVETTAPERGEP